TAVTEHGDIVFTREEREALERYEEIFDFVSNNTGNFVWENYAYDNEISQKQKAEILSREAREGNNKVYGTVIQNKHMNSPRDLLGEMYLSSDGEKAYGDNKIQQLRQDLSTLGLLVQKTKRSGEVEDRVDISKNARSAWGF
ncbi:hypothetical protein, partial [Escherichia coli]|uniref:hypothetical protein n=2 Tax=Enterobacteriaceae TaxID=543 RepID=UPI0013B0386B